MALFVAFMCVILSMYGGGFATVPAYLADMFGTQYVGAIHGRLLTAWSTAGVIGPLAHHPDPRDADRGRRAARGRLCANPVHLRRLPRPRLRLQPAHSSRGRALVHARKRARCGRSAIQAPAISSSIGPGGFSPAALVAWAAVGIPLLWGIWITLSKALVIFS